MKKPRFAKEQHEKMGKELQIIRDRLGQISVEIGGSYPLSLGATNLITKAQDLIDELRNRMDSMVFAESGVNATHDLCKIYYRSGDAGDRTPDFSESSLVVAPSQTK